MQIVPPTGRTRDTKHLCVLSSAGDPALVGHTGAANIWLGQGGTVTVLSSVSPENIPDQMRSLGTGHPFKDGKVAFLISGQKTQAADRLSRAISGSLRQDQTIGLFADPGGRVVEAAATVSILSRIGEPGGRRLALVGGDAEDVLALENVLGIVADSVTVFLDSVGRHETAKNTTELNLDEFQAVVSRGSVLVLSVDQLTAANNLKVAIALNYPTPSEPHTIVPCDTNGDTVGKTLCLGYLPIQWLCHEIFLLAMSEIFENNCELTANRLANLARNDPSISGCFQN